MRKSLVSEEGGGTVLHFGTNTFLRLKVGAPGNLAKTLYESKKLLKFIETVNILLTQINIQEKG